MRQEVKNETRHAGIGQRLRVKIKERVNIIAMTGWGGGVMGMWGY